MPKNEKGGKHKHLKKDNGDRKVDITRMPTPEKFVEYDNKGNLIPVFVGLVTGVCGGFRFKVKSFNQNGLNSIETICLLQKSIAKTGYINNGSLVLYGLRSFESKKEENMKGDIIYIYNKDEVPFLKQFELIPQNYETLLDNSKNGSTVEESGFEWNNDVNIEEL